MKKLTIALALILCLVVSVFAFASCGKNKAASTTAAQTKANGTTECAHTWSDYVVDLEPTCSDPGIKSKYCTKCGAQDISSIAEIEVIDHTPSADYTIDTYPTCSDYGYKSIHCAVCGQIIATTVERLDKDPKAHSVEDADWIVTTDATLFQLGSRHGECKLCGTDVVEEFDSFTEWVYTPTTSAQNGYEVNVASDVLKDKHFYPDASNGNAGLDLYLEFSLLWNPSLLKVSNKDNQVLVANIHPMPWKDGNDVMWMSLVDNAKGSDGIFAGGFEYTATRTVEYGPDGMSQQTANDNKVGNQYTDFPNIGGNVAASATDLNNGHEWGWHRVALVIHEELTNEAAVKTGEDASYLITCSVFIDGVKIYTLSNTESPDFNKSSYKDHNLLFTAKGDGAGGITYTDIGESEILRLYIPTTATTADTAYAVLADISVTAGAAGSGVNPGTGFVQSVSKNASPAANTYTTKDGTDTAINAPIWFTINP